MGFACSSCGKPVPSGSRFCPSCGTPSENATIAIEERRVVTVLFADLVGYTSLAEHLDPEAVTRLVESYFQPLVAEIETFGGRVDKVLGDAIIALFGAPVAHEDDADRAVRAALRMQETFTRLVAERTAEEDENVDDADPVDDISMRIGINTGEVLVGTIAGSDYTAMGDVVNTASRLQALAPPGSVLIGAATEALCSPAITREPFGVTPIRGRQQAEQPWIVTGATAAGARPVRCDIPFVGRIDELALLESTISLVRAGHSGVVSIVGEPGCGKSRLADHIVTKLADEAIILETACSPYGETSLWSPLRNGLATLLALEPDAGPDEVRDDRRAALRRAVVAEARRRTARTAARRDRLPVRPPVGSRRPRSGRRPRSHHRGRHRSDALPCPDTHDRAVGRQPAMGRPDAFAICSPSSFGRLPTCRSS